MFIATAMDDEAHILTRKVSQMIHRILFNARNISPLRLTLLSTVLLDELITGFPVVGLFTLDAVFRKSRISPTRLLSWLG